MPCASDYLSSLLIFLTSLLAFSIQAATGQVSCKIGDDTGLWPLIDCSDDLCVAERGLDDIGQPTTFYYCLNKNLNPHWRDSCNGLTDTSTNVVQCCIEENCHTQLLPRLPSEPPVPTAYPPYRPATASATTSSTSPTGSTDEDSTTEEHVSTEEVVATSTMEGKKLIKCWKRIEGVPLNTHPGYCYGNACYLELNRNGNPVVLGCLDEDIVDIQAFCSPPDTDLRVVSCCYARDNCNILLNPTFPPEEVTTVQTPFSDTTAGGVTGQMTEDYVTLIVLVIFGIIAVVLMVIIATFIATFIIYMLWRKYNQTKIDNGFENPCPSTPSDIMSSAGSSEADLDTPTTIKGHSLA